MLDKDTKDLLPSIIRDTMDTLSALTNAPDEMTLPITLAVANFATQALTNVDPMAWRPCAISEYFCVLVPSGGMKTSISDYLMDGIKEFEREQERDNMQEAIDYMVATKVFQKEIQDEAKNQTGNKIKEPVKPTGWRYRVEKATTNGLIDTLDAVPFAGLFSSDAGEFFNSHSFQDQGKSIEMITMLSKAWSGEMIDRVTGIKENNVRLHNRRFNMLVMLQQQLAGFLNNSQYKDQGFTNRMLITQCELFPKKQVDFSPTGNAETKRLQATLAPFNNRVFQLLSSVKHQQLKARMQEGKGEFAGPNELLLKKIGFDINDGATTLMEAFCNEMGAASQQSAYEEYSNFMSRVYEHACRLAATLAAFEKKDVISVEHAACAIGLMRYFIDQRFNLTIDGSIRSNPIVDCGDAVIKFLKKHNGIIGKTDLLQRGPAQYRKMVADDRARVMGDLEARELIEIQELPNENGRLVVFVGLAKVAKTSSQLANDMLVQECDLLV